jgi:formylglycine-generating enzyme required for sulfatase activity
MSEPPEGKDFVAIAAGTYFSLALKSDGSIVGWGRNTFGQTDTPKGNDFIAISADAGSNHGLALKSDGSIVGWGNRGVPRGWDHGEARPPGGNNFTAIAAGFSHNLALKADGTIIGWGSNSSGQANPPPGNDYIAISAGADHSLALKSDGSIVGWGSNTFGELDIPEGNDFTAIAAGHDYSLALKSDGSIVGWGHNSHGEARPPLDNDFVAIAAGTRQSLALRSDGRIVGWGDKFNMEKPFLPEQETGEKDKEEVKKEVTEAVELEDISSLQSFESPPKRIRITAEDKLSIDLVYIKPGSFIMGRDIGRGEKFLSRIAPFEASYPNDGPSRKVKITKGFYIGKYKVTCTQFCEFLNSIDNPQDYVELNKFARIEIKDGIYVPRKDCKNGAINVVHWKGAEAFCEWLSKQTGFTVRLPTEAEWEFTACGPEGRTYPWGENGNVKYYADPAYEYKKYPHPWSCDPVDAYEETATPDGVVGMICMLGEWCSDYYMSSYMKDDLIDPRGPTEEDLKDESVNPFGYKYRVFRGRLTGCKGRAFGDTVHGSGIYGFRILVELPQDLNCVRL